MATHEHRAPVELLTSQEWQSIIAALRLSPREAQMVRLAFHDESVSTIAEQLGVSTHTVHTYRERLFRKLGVHTFCQVITVVFSTYLATRRVDASISDGSRPDTPAPDASQADLCGTLPRA